MHAFFVRLNGDRAASQPEGVYKQRDSTECEFGLPLVACLFNAGLVKARLHQEEGYAEYDIYHEQE